MTDQDLSNAGGLEAEIPGGRNLHFGIREHAMAAILNGMALSKLRVYGSSLLTFSDYMKPPIRLSALMEAPIVGGWPNRRCSSP
jgi:transketolase